MATIVFLKARRSQLTTRSYLAGCSSHGAWGDITRMSSIKKKKTRLSRLAIRLSASHSAARQAAEAIMADCSCHRRLQSS